MRNNNNKNHEFSHEEIVEMELVLIKAIEAFHESPRREEIKGYVQDYFVRYCCERKFPLQDTLDFVNPRFRRGIHLKMSDIVPESKRGQAHLVNISLLRLLNENKEVFDDKKRSEVLTNFCGLTGISKDIATPIVEGYIKLKRKNVIEKDLYPFLETTVSKIEKAKDRKEIEDDVFGFYSEQLHVDSDYIKGVLRNKKKRDSAEKKEKAAKSLSTDNDAR